MITDHDISMKYCDIQIKKKKTAKANDNAKEKRPKKVKTVDIFKTVFSNFKLSRANGIFASLLRKILITRGAAPCM